MLGILTATINFLRGFPDRDSNKEPDADTMNRVHHIITSSAWQNFGIYLLALFIFLMMLTVISFVLLLLAVERNTRKTPIKNPN